MLSKNQGFNDNLALLIQLIKNLTTTDMTLSPSFKKIAVETICFLYILLFVYAAVSKLIDFETFKIQLGQSPIIAAYAQILAILVPGIEILIAIFLVIPRLKLLGLLLSFSLMIMFTVYIIIILNWSYYVPCSCGGILEKMGWTEHFIFNIGFVILALTAIMLIQYNGNSGNVSGLFFYTQAAATAKRLSVSISLTVVFSISVMMLLYFSAEKLVQRNNAFQRRFPPHPLAFINSRPLKYNSYYLAGITNGRIYLGNSTASLHALEIDTLLKNETILRLQLKELHENKYLYLQLRVRDSNYFLSDRGSSVIFRGHIGTWTARELAFKMPDFSILEPIGYDTFAIKTINEKTEDELAIVQLGSKPTVLRNPGLLKKQIDGIFDTDGILLYNDEQKRILYPYYYRNQYIVADRNAALIALRSTIDTVTTARIKIAKDISKNKSLLAEMPTTINAGAATDGKLLYIKSKRLSKNDPEKILNEAVIIDVYNFITGNYLYSFYLYNFEGQKTRSFAVKGDLVIALTDKHIVTYRLRKDILNLGSENH
ncbi:MauE/DoxX family redox-associated membrane protein [Flavobacterium sp. AG291]|uniref:MauE/DoxX family redox-associated membrane protein n=1 Tax=Flavobacterium sp. AG291 TaxID=2184000 RepID=UPI000E2B1CA6|nr:MauE/DoxX family redox-associated membrane protein [Flavobacterium sp. AG291]RDI11241.1 methylamine utilization protein MauE [Flavobacterium sp. AG291]